MLVADVGGTKLTMGLIDAHAVPLRIQAQESFKCADGANLTEFLTRFQHKYPHTPRVACIAGAGPVKEDVIAVTNLPWRIASDEIRRMGYESTYLINDLVAHASAVPHLSGGQVHVLQEGSPQDGPMGLIAAGTGLGEALIVRSGERYIVNPSEGGHCSFAPGDEEQIALLRFLHRTYSHVSWERVVSGKFGFRHIAAFLLEQARTNASSDLKEAVATQEDLGSLIHEKARGGDPMAMEVIRLFLKLYGAEAGNLALKGFTVGGLFLGGGVIRQLMPFVAQSAWIDSFCAKGRFSQLMRDIPVRVILDQDNALLGAGYYARDRLPS